MSSRPWVIPTVHKCLVVKSEIISSINMKGELRNTHANGNGSPRFDYSRIKRIKLVSSLLLMEVVQCVKNVKH